MSTPLNVGPKSAAWLRQVGVRTREDLEAMGMLGVYRNASPSAIFPVQAWGLHSISNKRGYHDNQAIRTSRHFFLNFFPCRIYFRISGL